MVPSVRELSGRKGVVELLNLGKLLRVACRDVAAGEHPLVSDLEVVASSCASEAVIALAVLDSLVAACAPDLREDPGLLHAQAGSQGNLHVAG